VGAVSDLPQRGATGVIVRPSLRALRSFVDRDLLEQSIAERLAKAVIAACFLWLAIWWALW
jgi:hypothetical protein